MKENEEENNETSDRTVVGQMDQANNSNEGRDEKQQQYYPLTIQMMPQNLMISTGHALL